MGELSKAELSEYNFLVAVDSSGSMGAVGRWEAAKAIALAVANFAGQVDTDGIDIVTFGATVEAYEKSNADKIGEIFAKGPSGSTPLAEALTKANEIRKLSNKKSFTVVITDGAPDDEAAVIRLLTEVANSITQDNAATFLFIQIGEDEGATKFLVGLDDGLKGTKFDIVDRKTVAEFDSLGFEKLFYAAQNG